MLLRACLAIEPADLRRRLSRLFVEPVAVVIAGGHDALARPLAGESCDLVVVSHRAIDADPAGWVRRFQRLADRPEVIVVRDGEDARDRARLLAAGMLAVLDSRLDDPELAAALAALARRRRRGELVRLHGERPPAVAERLLGSASPAMRELLAAAAKVARSDTPLLILGETGAGKEWLARSIHAAGGRAAEGFHAVNCGALPEPLIDSELFGHVKGAYTGADRSRRGCFELAHRGTLLLDEIGEMAPASQARLLRVLEEKRVRRLGSEEQLAVDVRIVAATSRDLTAARAGGHLRDDLYFRLAVVVLEVPPLRHRPEDLPALAGGALARIGARLGRPGLELTAASHEALAAYPWPGNVRELMSVLERSALLADGDRIGVAELRLGEPSSPWRPTAAAAARATAVGPADAQLGETIEAVRRRAIGEAERRYLEAQLRATGGGIGETARRAGIGPRALHKKMLRYGLRKEDFRPPGGSPGRLSPPLARISHQPPSRGAVAACGC